MPDSLKLYFTATFTHLHVYWLHCVLVSMRTLNVHFFRSVSRSLPFALSRLLFPSRLPLFLSLCVKCFIFVSLLCLMNAHIHTHTPKHTHDDESTTPLAWQRATNAGWKEMENAQWNKLLFLLLFRLDFMPHTQIPKWKKANQKKKKQNIIFRIFFLSAPHFEAAAELKKMFPHTARMWRYTEIRSLRDEYMYFFLSLSRVFARILASIVSSYYYICCFFILRASFVAAAVHRVF